MMERREFLQTAGMTAAAFGVMGAAQAYAQGGLQVGICDWNIRNEKNEGGTCRPDYIPIAASANLKGIQVSVATGPSNVALRNRSVRQQYKELGKQHGIHFHSVAAGGILNAIPLKSEPESAVYVIEAIEAAVDLGAGNVLMAFFSGGDLRYQDQRGNLVKIQENPHEYLLDYKGVERVVNALKQIAPRAEELGVVLGLENTLSAKQNLEIIREVGSDYLQVYYDIGNSWTYGYDVPAEIRLLGNNQICEIHIKDNGTDVIGGEPGEVDFKACAEACRAIQYDKWYVIEESGRKDRFIDDTKTTVDFVKKTFA